MSLAAVQPSNIAQGTNALREYVAEKVEQVYENEAPFLRYWQKETDEVPVNVRGIRIPLETSPNPSLASGNANGGILATPGAPARNYLTVNYQWLNTGLEQTYEFTLNSNKNAVSDLSRRDVDNAVEQMMYWLDIYASQGDGTTKLAVASAAYLATNATTKTTFVAAGATDTIGASNLLVNQKIKIYDPTGVTQRTGTVGSAALTIATVSGTQFTTTTDLPSDYIIGDIVVPEGTNTTGIKGVPFIVGASGTYFGLSRTTNRGLRSTVVSAGGALSAANLLSTALAVKQKNGQGTAAGKGAVEIFYSLSQQYAYFNLVGTTSNPNMFVHDSNGRAKIDLGGDTMEFSFFGMPMHAMARFPGNAIYFLNMKYMKTAVLKNVGEMLGEPFNQWQLAVDSSANYLAARQKWWDVACDNFSPAPFRHGALTGLTYTNAPTQASVY